jgi:fructose 1,6-bisphosphate aldolase/phosphatase
MKVTLSVIKADIGGYVGHSSSHPDILAEADGYPEKLEERFSRLD